MEKRRNMSRLVLSLALTAALALLPLAGAAAAVPESLVPLGGTVGIQLNTEGMTVVGFTPVPPGSAEPSPAEKAGLLPGDIITELDGHTIDSADDFLLAVSGLDGGAVSLTAVRDGETLPFTLVPADNGQGAYQLGLWLRDGISGVGTLTYYDPESGVYGALGHGINDLDTGRLIPADSGEITASEVIDVVRGGSGSPGELCCKSDGDTVIGGIDSNTECGIFGVLRQSVDGEAVPVAEEKEIVLGKASILSNVSGNEIREYAVEITRLYHDAGSSRCMMLTVTDPELLAATGGIVQGMSGSPILQNGKLVGAVTHVLVSDPARGYGVSIEKMLQAA